MIFFFLLGIAQSCFGQDVVRYEGPYVVKHEILIAPHLITKKINPVLIQQLSSTGYQQPAVQKQIPKVLSLKSKQTYLAKLLEQTLNNRFAQYTEFQERLKISSYTQLLDFFKNRYENNKFGCLAHDCMHYDKDYRVEAEHYMHMHISKKFFSCVHHDCQAVFQSKKMLQDHVLNCDKIRI